MAPSSVPPPKEDDLDIPWMRIWYWAFNCTVYFFYGGVLVKFVAEALALTAPTFAGKLVKEPVLGIIPSLIPAFRAVTLGQVTALIMMFGVCWFFREMIRIHLQPDSEQIFEVEPYRQLVLPVGLVLVGCDAVFFLMGVQALSWGSIGFSFSALLITVVVVTLNVFVALVSLRLKKAAEDEDERRKLR